MLPFFNPCISIHNFSYCFLSPRRATYLNAPVSLYVYAATATYLFLLPALGSCSRVTKVRILHAFLFTILLGQAFCEKFYFFRPSQSQIFLLLFHPSLSLSFPSSSQIELCSLRLLLRSAVSLFRLSPYFLLD